MRRFLSPVPVLLYNQLSHVLHFEKKKNRESYNWIKFQKTINSFINSDIFDVSPFVLNANFPYPLKILEDLTVLLKITTFSGACQRRIQNSAKHPNRDILRKQLTAFIRCLFSQNAPSSMFDKVLDASLLLLGQSNHNFLKYR